MKIRMTGGCVVVSWRQQGRAMRPAFRACGALGVAAALALAGCAHPSSTTTPAPDPSAAGARGGEQAPPGGAPALCAKVDRIVRSGDRDRFASLKAAGTKQHDSKGQEYFTLPISLFEPSSVVMSCMYMSKPLPVAGKANESVTCAARLLVASEGDAQQEFKRIGDGLQGCLGAGWRAELDSRRSGKMRWSMLSFTPDGGGTRVTQTMLMLVDPTKPSVATIHVVFSP